MHKLSLVNPAYISYERNDDYMDDSICNSDIPLSIDGQPDNFAFDGCSYFFTLQCDREIIKTDDRFCIQKTLPVRRQYDHLCYDKHDQCFWASSKNCPGTVFKLNCQMVEIDRISLCRQKYLSGVITGLSLDCCDDTLIVSFTYCIVKLDKNSQTAEIRYTTADMSITSVLSICPGYLITGVKACSQFVFIMDETFTVIRIWPVDRDVVVRNACINPCLAESPEICTEFLVAQKGCYPYIYRRIKNKDMLGFLPCPCNYEICRCCVDPCCRDACADILESIALEESSISHILNAESDKIKKIISTSDNIDEILCVNREVNRTIVNVTHLEQVLYSKIAALSECCDLCECRPESACKCGEKAAQCRHCDE